MLRIVAALGFCVAVAVGSASAQTAIELKKELLPKLKKAQAEGKDLGPAAEYYKEGDEALKAGQQEEAIEAFQKAKEAWPAD